MREDEYEVRVCACGIPLREGEEVCVICAQTEEDQQTKARSFKQC